MDTTYHDDDDTHEKEEEKKFRFLKEFGRKKNHLSRSRSIYQLLGIRYSTRCV